MPPSACSSTFHTPALPQSCLIVLPDRAQFSDEGHRIQIMPHSFHQDQTMGKYLHRQKHGSSKHALCTFNKNVFIIHSLDIFSDRLPHHCLSKLIVHLHSGSPPTFHLNWVCRYIWSSSVTIHRHIQTLL